MQNSGTRLGKQTLSLHAIDIRCLTSLIRNIYSFVEGKMNILSFSLFSLGELFIDLSIALEFYITDEIELINDYI